MLRNWYELCVFNGSTSVVVFVMSPVVYVSVEFFPCLPWCSIPVEMFVFRPFCILIHSVVGERDCQFYYDLYYSLLLLSN